MRLSLADEAVRLGGNLDPQQRSLLQDATACAVAGLRKLRRKLQKRQATKKYIAAHHEVHLGRVRDWQQRNREHRRIYSLKYHKAHVESRRAQQRASKARHAERFRLRAVEWSRKNRQKNGDKLRAYHRGYRPKWRAKQKVENPCFLLKDRLRSALKRGLTQHGLKKTARTEAMTGCSVDHLRKHFESQFVNGMSWANPESYSIDHIIPISAFNLLDAEERFWSFNWQNLRPMPLLENKRKHATVPFPLPPWLPTHIAQRIIHRSTL